MRLCKILGATSFLLRPGHMGAAGSVFALLEILNKNFTHHGVMLDVRGVVTAWNKMSLAVWQVLCKETSVLGQNEVMLTSTHQHRHLDALHVGMREIGVKIHHLH